MLCGSIMAFRQGCIVGALRAREQQYLDGE
jgi:hypothetical protein